jgi:hypothetical protein
MGAADAGAPGCGAHDCHPAECWMGGASSGQAGGGRLGIAGLARGRLSFSSVGLPCLGRTSARGSARGTCSIADLGRAAPAAASRRGSDLGLTSACLTARVHAGAFVGRAGCPSAGITPSRRARSVLGRPFGSSSILEFASRSGLGRSPGGSSRPCASRPRGRRMGRRTRDPVLGGAARSGASSAAHRRPILGSHASLTFVSAACALVGPALSRARMGASADRGARRVSCSLLGGAGIRP